MSMFFPFKGTATDEFLSERLASQFDYNKFKSVRLQNIGVVKITIRLQICESVRLHNMHVGKMTKQIRKNASR